MVNNKRSARVAPAMPKTHRNKVQLCLWVTPELDTQLRARAERDKAPISEVVRAALAKYLGK